MTTGSKGLENNQFLEIGSTHRHRLGTLPLRGPGVVLGEPLTKPPSNHRSTLERQHQLSRLLIGGRSPCYSLPHLDQDYFLGRCSSKRISQVVLALASC